jgi:hypothetical protein
MSIGVGAWEGELEQRLVRVVRRERYEADSQAFSAPVQAMSNLFINFVHINWQK